MRVKSPLVAGERPGRILVVDDSWLILERIRLDLAEAGYEVRASTAPDLAARAVRLVDLAIVDFHMPGTNGGELVIELKQNVGIASHCLFYLYTSDRAVASAYQRYGFDGAFLKKGEEGALVSQVDAVFRTLSMRLLAERMRAVRHDVTYTAGGGLR